MALVQVRAGVRARVVTNPRSGVQVTLAPGKQFDEDNPVVQRWPELFERPGEPLVAPPKRGRRGRVRTATAEPVAEIATAAPEASD